MSVECGLGWLCDGGRIIGPGGHPVLGEEGEKTAGVLSWRRTVGSAWFVARRWRRQSGSSSERSPASTVAGQHGAGASSERVQSLAL
jgi:hypothetical protein